MTGRGAVTGADYKQIDNALMISQRKLFHFQFHLGPNLWFPIFRQFLFRVSVSLTHSLTSTGHQPAPLEIYIYISDCVSWEMPWEGSKPTNPAPLIRDELNG